MGEAAADNIKKRRRFDAGTCAYLGAAVLLVAIRQVYAAGLPLFVRVSTCDDRLMVAMAEGLLNKNWLGPYNGLTLMKGCFYPMFLSAVSACGLKYLSVLTALHSAACLFFVRQVRPLFRSRLFDGILLAVLLFDPSSMADRSFQAIYRTALTGSQVLLIFGCFFGLYLTVGRRPAVDLIKGLFGGFLLWGFLNTREDSVWILPFVIAASGLIIARAVKASRTEEERRRAYLIGASAVLLPLLIVPAGNAFIRHQNLKYYGAAVRLECSDGAFAEALKTMYAVKDKEPVPLVSVTREKLERFYDVSPELASIRDELDAMNAMYDQGADRHAGDGEVEDGWFLWSLKRAAFEAGQTESLQSSEAFYKKVTEEIEAALDDPSSSFERGRSMPSSLMSPLQAGYPAAALKALLRAVRAVAAYENVGAAAVSGHYAGTYGELCASLTGEKVLYEENADVSDQAKAEAAVSRVSRLSRLYGAVMSVLLPVSLLAFLLLLVYALVRQRKGDRPLLWAAAGLLLTSAVDLTGVAYTDISAFRAIRCDYLAGVYPLALAFAAIVLFKVFLMIVGRWKT